MSIWLLFAMSNSGFGSGKKGRQSATDAFLIWRAIIMREGNARIPRKCVHPFCLWKNVFGIARKLSHCKLEFWLGLVKVPIQDLFCHKAYFKTTDESQTIKLVFLVYLSSSNSFTNTEIINSWCFQRVFVPYKSANFFGPFVRIT